MIRKLLQRLSTPTVASALSKEQLCVSLAAVAQLEPFHLLPRTAPQASSRNALDFKEEEADALVTQSMRLIPYCSFMELGMLAGGAAALRWHSPALVEQLSKQAYRGYENIHSSRDRLRLTDLARIISAAICGGQYFNVTLHTFLCHHTKGVLRSKERLENLLHFAFLACIYLGGHNDFMHTILAQLRAACRDGQQRDFMQKYENFAHQVCAGWIARRQSLLTEFQSSYGDHSESSEHVWSIARARMHLYFLLHEKIQGNGFLTPGKEVPFSDVVECLELLAFYRIEDPVAQQALEETVLSAMQKTDAITGDDMRKLNQVVYSNAQRLPRLVDALNNRNASSRSIQKISYALQAYADAAKGKRASGVILHRLMEELEDAQPDHIAYAACVLARQSEIPAFVTVRSSSIVRHLSLKGVAAFLRAAKWDRTGALLASAEMAVRNLDLTSLNSAPLSVLLDLASTAALPLPRHVNIPRAFEDAEAMLKHRLLKRLSDVCNSPLQPLADMTEVALQVLAFDTDRTLMHLVLNRAAAAKELTRAEWLSVMQLLIHDSHVSSLALMDKLSDRFKELLNLCLQSGGHGDVNVRETLLEIAAFQAEYDAPELEGLGNQLLHRVEGKVGTCATEFLIAAGLLAKRARRFRIYSLVQATLVSHVLDGTLSLSVATYAVNLVSPAAESTNAALTVALARFFINASQNSGNATDCAPLVDPSSVTRLLVLYCAQYERLSAEDHFMAFPEDLLQLVADNLLGLDLEVYVDLCRFLSGRHLPEGFTDEVVESLPRQLDRLSSAQIALCVWGLGQLHHAGQRLSHQVAMERVSDYVVDNADLFWSGPDIARMLDGFARLHCTKRSLYNVFAGKLAMRAVRATMNREAINLALYAFGMVKYLDKNLFDRLAQVYIKNANALSAEDVLFSVLAHSRMMLLNGSFYEQMGQQITAHAAEFSLAAKCELLKAYGHVRQKQDAVAQTLLRGVAQKIQELQSGNDAVNVLDALWQMDYNMSQDEDGESLASFVVEHVEQLTSNSMQKLCSVLTGCGWRHTPLLQAIGDQCVQLAKRQQLTAPAGRAVLDTFGFLMIRHPVARRELAQLARTVSKEVVQLSEEEAEKLRLLLPS